MQVYDIDPDKSAPKQTAVELANTALAKFIEYEGKSMKEILLSPEWLEEVSQRLRENMRSTDGNVSNKAIELWGKFSDSLINKSAHMRGEVNLTPKASKWKKED